jgi:hypothetical protein
MNDHFFPIDTKYGARVEIDSMHHLIHDGKVWDCHIETLTATVNTVLDVYIKTGSKEVHLDFNGEAIGGMVLVQFYEDAIMTTAGTAISTYSRNRSNITTAETLIYTSPSVSTVGTLVGTRRIFASTSNQGKVTSAIHSGGERIWKANSTYLTRITTSVATTQVACDVLFYEV